LLESDLVEGVLVEPLAPADEEAEDSEVAEDPVLDFPSPDEDAVDVADAVAVSACLPFFRASDG
jgi:hypothetical protein